MDHFTKQSLELLAQANVRLDANESVFLERELTQLRAKMFDTKFGAIKGLSFAPLASDISASTSTFAYKVYTEMGQARIIADGADDPPRVDVKAAEVTGKVYMIGDAYGWDLNEMAEAARLGVPLSQKRANAAKAAIDRGIDDMLLLGEPTGASTNLVTTGIANAASVTVHSGNFTHWVAATDDDVIIDEVNAFVTTQVEAVKENGDLVGDTLLLPLNRYNIIANKRLGVDADTTVLQFVIKNSAYIKAIEPWYRLTGAGAGGLDRAIFYKKSPEVLEAIVPVLFEQLPPQAKNYSFNVPCFARCGGVAVYHPTGVRYRDFASS